MTQIMTLRKQLVYIVVKDPPCQKQVTHLAAGILPTRQPGTG